MVELTALTKIEIMLQTAKELLKEPRTKLSFSRETQERSVSILKNCLEYVKQAKEEGRVEGAIEKLNLVLEKSYFISRTEVSIKQIPTLRVYIKDLIKQLEKVGEQK